MRFGGRLACGCGCWSCFGPIPGQGHASAPQPWRRSAPATAARSLAGAAADTEDVRQQKQCCRDHAHAPARSAKGGAACRRAPGSAGQRQPRQGEQQDRAGGPARREGVGSPTGRSAPCRAAGARAAAAGGATGRWAYSRLAALCLAGAAGRGLSGDAASSSPSRWPRRGGPVGRGRRSGRRGAGAGPGPRADDDVQALDSAAGGGDSWSRRPRKMTRGAGPGRSAPSRRRPGAVATSTR